MKPTKPTVYDVIASRITELLEQGTVPWRKPWVGEAQAPRSLNTDKPYRGINALLLHAAGFASPYFLTFRQIAERGATLRKGSKGLPVVFWKWPSQSDEGGPEEATGEQLDRKGPILRYYTVFNASQCEGLEVPGARPTLVRSSDETFRECEAIVDAMPSRPSILHTSGTAAYSAINDLVVLPHLTDFPVPAEYYSTLFHELAHSTGHKTRLARPGITDPRGFGDHAYSREELIAEMTAAFLCGHCGIESKTLDNSAAYIAHWLRALANDRRMVVLAAASAQKAADFILSRDAAPAAAAA